MELVNYSSSSESETEPDNKTEKCKGLLWLSDDDEDIKEFEIETKKQLNLIKSNEKLQQLAHDLTENEIGPQKCEFTLITHDTFNETEKDRLTKAKRKPIKTENTPNKKLKSEKFHQQTTTERISYGPFKKLYFQTKISDKCVSSLEWYNNGLTFNKQWVLISSLDGSVSIWNCLIREPIFSKTSCHHGGCKRAIFVGDKIFSVGFDKFGRLNDVEKGQETFQCENESSVTSCCQLNSDENILLTGTRDVINVWDTRSRGDKTCKTFNIGCGQVLDFNFLPNQNEIVCCGDKVTKDSCERNLSIWDYRSGALLSNEIYHERYTCVRLKIDAIRNQFVAQTNGSYVAIFSAKPPYKMNKYKRFEAHKVVGYPIDICFNRDCSTLASGDAEGKVYFYNANTANVWSVLNCNVNQPITSLAWSHNNKLVLGTWNGFFQNWG